MDQVKASIHGVETMEARENPLRGAAPPGRGARPGGANRRERSRSVADQKQSRARHRPAKRLLRQDRPSFHGSSPCRSINRTAVYGPVCPVVWEGRSRKASPYPDCGQWGFRRPWRRALGRRGPRAFARKQYGLRAAARFVPCARPRGAVFSSAQSIQSMVGARSARSKNIAAQANQNIVIADIEKCPSCGDCVDQIAVTTVHNESILIIY